MRNKKVLFLLTVLSILCTVSFAAADSGLYPIGQQYQQSQPSYPVPQYYPYGQQQNQYSYPYNSQQYYYYQPTATPVPNYQPHYYYQPTPQPITPQQYYYPSQPQQQYYNQQPYYDPNTKMYFYPISGWEEAGPIAQPQNNQYYPSYQDNNVQVSKQISYDGSVNLTWTIRNITNEDWPRSNIDIKCISGCQLLTNPNKTLWDIPYTVKKNGMLSFTINIWQPMYNESMTFAMIAGSKTLYTFTVYPN